MSATLAELRSAYHQRLCGTVLSATVGPNGLPYHNIADGANANSVAIARAMVERIGHPIHDVKLKPQQLGQLFANATCDYLRGCFGHLAHLRPGTFAFAADQPRDGIKLYDQYAHLAILSDLAKIHKELRSTLGGEYLVMPDIVVLKRPFTDAEINAAGEFVADDGLATLTPLRQADTLRPTLHASVSCKWTMRSDRAQNIRTEALNLLRNRKGQAPRIAAVTFEPMPSRLVSIAIGTGDVDCTYHVALHELRAAIHELGLQDQEEQLDDLIVGRRIRDISDLPLDLAI